LMIAGSGLLHFSSQTWTKTAGIGEEGLFAGKPPAFMLAAPITKQS
jgi:hypothetical protein